PLHQGMWRSQSHDAAVAEIGDADVILAVDRLDVAGALRSRAGRPVHLVNVSLESYATRSWSADYQEVVLAEIAITASAGPTTAWEFTRPHAHLGHDGGAGVGSGPGIAVGAALAARGSGRTVVAVIGDGELLAAPTALWTAAHHAIPILFVIANNQSYFNDEEHQ